MVDWLGKSGAALAIGAAWIVLVYLVLPLLVLAAVSFTTAEYLQFPPEALTFRWYIKYLTNPTYLASIGLSVWLSIVSTIGALALGVPAALVLSRASFPGLRPIGAFFLSPLILPTIILGITTLQFSVLLGYERSYFALIIGHVVLVTPFVVRATLVSLAAVDRSLEEAALDLGASSAATFFLVTLPVIKPGLIAGGMFALIISWIDVEVSIFNTVPDDLPIPLTILNYVQDSVDPMIAAVSATTILLSVVLVVMLDLVVGLDRLSIVRN